MHYMWLGPRKPSYFPRQVVIFLIKIQTCQYTIKLYSQSESILSGLLLLTTFSWSVREVLVHGGALVVGANLGKKKPLAENLVFGYLLRWWFWGQRTVVIIETFFNTCIRPSHIYRNAFTQWVCWVYSI